MIVDEILKVSRIMPSRHPFPVLAKLMEETGELAQEINIREGFIVNKEPGKDGIIGECADVLNCVIDILYLYHNDITEEEFNKINLEKLLKWKNYLNHE